jgi:predicted transcriptional regulator
MRAPNRAREEIIAAMLKAVAASPSKSTHIMYKVSMSYFQLTQYLRLAQSRKLMAKAGDGNWHITEKGREYLESYNQLMHILGEVQQEKGEQRSATEA